MEERSKEEDTARTTLRFYQSVSQSVSQLDSVNELITVKYISKDSKLRYLLLSQQWKE
jgi:hypothetical protein